MHFGKARREGQGWLSLTSGATLSKGHQRPALRGFASKLPAALQTFERQPAFLHDCAFRAVSAQSLRHHLIDQRCLNLLIEQEVGDDVGQMLPSIKGTDWKLSLSIWDLRM